MLKHGAAGCAYCWPLPPLKVVQPPDHTNRQQTETVRGTSQAPQSRRTDSTTPTHQLLRNKGGARAPLPARPPNQSGKPSPQPPVAKPPVAVAAMGSVPRCLGCPTGCPQDNGHTEEFFGDRGATLFLAGRGKENPQAHDASEGVHPWNFPSRALRFRFGGRRLSMTPSRLTDRHHRPTCRRVHQAGSQIGERRSPATHDGRHALVRRGGAGGLR